MSDDYSICTNSYQLQHSSFDKTDKGIRKGQPLNVSMHGKVKVYTKQEIKDFNESRGLI